MSTTTEILLGVWFAAGFAAWYGVVLLLEEHHDQTCLLPGGGWRKPLDMRSAHLRLLLLSPVLGPLALLGSIVVVSVMMILHFLAGDEKL